MVRYIALILLFLPAYMVRFNIFGIPTTLLEILIYGAVVGLVIARPLGEIGRSLKKLWQEDGWPVLLFLIAGIISALIAPDKRAAFGLLKAYIVDPILLLVIIIASQPNVNQRALYWRALLLGGLIAGLSAFFGASNNEGRAIGLYVFDVNPSPNYLALLLAPVAALAFGHLVAIGRPDGLTLASFTLGASGLWLTGSRGGWLALILSMVIGQLIGLRQRGAKWLKGHRFTMLTAVIVVTVLALGWQFSRPDFSDQASRRATTSNNLRYEIWRTTVVDILPAKGLFGVGLANFQPYFSQITAERINFPEYISPWARTPHNLFLTIWTNLGLLGLVAFIWLIINFFRRTSRADTPWRLGLLLAMTTILIHGLVDASYWKNDLAALFWALMAMSYLESGSKGEAKNG